MHPAYAESLSFAGEPMKLPGCEGWVLRRQIPESDLFDAMGCYPLFSCAKWSQLHKDLEEVGESLVSISLVPDPFGSYDHDYLRKCFPDVAMPFKEHYVVDLGQSPESFIHPHHRRNARKARTELNVEECAASSTALDEWTALYESLVTRHKITGIAAFSRESFARQLRVPGLVGFRATQDGRTLGMVLWYVQDNRAYYHLGAYSTRGYDLRASFALFEYSIEYFRRLGLEWLSLGAGVGTGPNLDTGLNRFKMGWSTGTRTAYFCGRIFDQNRYQQIVSARNAPVTKYFPAYRLGEFQ